MLITMLSNEKITSLRQFTQLVVEFGQVIDTTGATKLCGGKDNDGQQQPKSGVEW